MMSICPTSFQIRTHRKPVNPSCSCGMSQHDRDLGAFSEEPAPRNHWEKQRNQSVPACALQGTSSLLLPVRRTPRSIPAASTPRTTNLPRADMNTYPLRIRSTRGHLDCSNSAWEYHYVAGYRAPKGNSLGSEGGHPCTSGPLLDTSGCRPAHHKHKGPPSLPNTVNSKSLKDMPSHHAIQLCHPCTRLR
jgi:hypothetical protein